MDSNVPLKEEILSIINDRQQIGYDELSDIAFSRGVPESELAGVLGNLESSKMIASRSNGGIQTYYILQEQNGPKRVLIVEDDKNINKLMAISIGKGFDVGQVYDGGEAIKAIRMARPDLIILDLMLPHKDGLEICQAVKSDPETANTIIILVSAMNPTNNRFKGIKYGADYYIKKPFDPAELRTLVTIFLKKKGKRFDPLIDLPDEERISKEVERYIKEGEAYSIGTLKIDGLAAFARRFGEPSAIVILRLISQLLQDSIGASHPSLFAGFLNSDQFVLAGKKNDLESTIEHIKKEFVAVLPFIMQDSGYKLIDKDIDALFESEEVPKLSLVYEQKEKDKIKEIREEILKSRGTPADDIGSYTYEELQKLFGRDDLDIKITRGSGGVRLHVGKLAEDNDDKKS